MTTQRPRTGNLFFFETSQVVAAWPVTANVWRINVHAAAPQNRKHQIMRGSTWRFTMTSIPRRDSEKLGVGSELVEAAVVLVLSPCLAKYVIHDDKSSELGLSSELQNQEKYTQAGLACPCVKASQWLGRLYQSRLRHAFRSSQY
jgi:hypothetical protein